MGITGNTIAATALNLSVVPGITPRVARNFNSMPRYARCNRFFQSSVFEKTLLSCALQLDLEIQEMPLDANQLNLLTF